MCCTGTPLRTAAARDTRRGGMPSLDTPAEEQPATPTASKRNENESPHIRPITARNFPQLEGLPSRKLGWRQLVHFPAVPPGDCIGRTSQLLVFVRCVPCSPYHSRRASTSGGVAQPTRKRSFDEGIEFACSDFRGSGDRRVFHRRRGTAYSKGTWVIFFAGRKR